MKILVCISNDELEELCAPAGSHPDEHITARELERAMGIQFSQVDLDRGPLYLNCPLEIVVV